MIDDATFDLAAALLDELRRRRWLLATAESCTGGLIAAALTAIPGSSYILDRGFVTYSNTAKHEMLGVPEAMIATHGAVSHAVAEAMAEGAIAYSAASLAIAVTGIAGPDGGSPTKPVGLVWFGLAARGSRTLTDHRIFPGDRTEVRRATVAHALAMLRRRAVA